MRYLILALLLLPIVQGVVIQGKIYDFSLNSIDAIIEINTTPKQVIVAKNGTYSFTVEAGRYILRAKHAQSGTSISEEILAVNEGKYRLDLILLPDFEEEELEEYSPDLEGLSNDERDFTWPIIVILIAILIIVYAVKKKQTVIEKHIEVKTIATELQHILQFIEKEGGRTTQKDIRRQFNHSEAKISLMLDEMEAKGLVERIKKGRGNVIVKK